VLLGRRRGLAEDVIDEERGRHEQAPIRHPPR
jgi:hypothetical protein